MTGQNAEAQTISRSDTPPPLALPICIGWGLGTLGLQSLLQAVNTLVMKYMIDVLGVTAVLAGFIMAATRVFDALTDPVMGSISDRTHSRWGRRRPYLLIGGAFCAIIPIFMFVMPGSVPGDLLLGYIVVTLLAFALAYTIFNVPHLAMPVEMTQSASERTRLFTFRMYGFAIANLIGGSLAPWIVGHYGGDALGYQMMGLFMAGVVLIACLASFAMTASAPFMPVDMQRPKFTLKSLLLVFESKPLRTLLLIKVALVTGSGVSAGGLAFLVVSIMERPLTIFPVFGALLTIGLMVCQPLWLALSTRIGKRNCYLTASAFYALVQASWLLSGPGESLAVFGIRGFLIGLGAGGALLISQSMLPDVVQYEIDRTGHRNEGLLAGLFSTAERGSSALGVAIGGLILGFGGYISGNGDGAQPQSAIYAIYGIASIGPTVGIVLSMVAASFYTLDRDKAR